MSLSYVKRELLNQNTKAFPRTDILNEKFTKKTLLNNRNFKTDEVEFTDRIAAYLKSKT